MRIGRVTDTGRAYVPILVVGASGNGHEVKALLDTGFDGAVALPPSQIAALGACGLPYTTSLGIWRRE